MMTLNARLLGLLSLLLALFVAVIGLIVDRLPSASVSVRPSTFFAAPVAEGGLLFSALLEQLDPPSRSPRATLVLDEVITPVLAGRILAMADAELAYVELDSVGGDVEASIAIASRLRTARAHTHVASGAKCFSACTVIFQAGVERSAGADALFLLHYAVQVSDDPNHAHVGSIWGTVALVEAMIDLGADPSIYDQMPGYGDWLLSGEQAVALGLVQQVIPVSKAVVGVPTEKVGA